MSVTWLEIAERETVAARAGRQTWREFVAWAEGVTGMPWSRIRVQINPLVQEIYARQESEARALEDRVAVVGEGNQ